MKLVKKILSIVLIVTLMFCLASCAKYCWDSITYKETFEYALYEMNDGIYGYYNIVSSSIPAQNYEVVTLYFADGVCYYADNPGNLYVIDF